MNRGPYSKISQFNMITILTKAFINSYEIPKDKNDYCWKNIKYLKVICNEKNKKITIKKEYKKVLNKFIKNFNSFSFKNICMLTKYNLFPFSFKNTCMLTKYNLFPFLMVIAETCKYQVVNICQYLYIPELQNELEEIKKTLKEAIINNDIVNEKQSEEDKKNMEGEIEKYIKSLNQCLKNCISISINDLFFCNYLNISSFIENFLLEEKLKLLEIILVLQKK